MSKRQSELFLFDIFVAIVKIEKTASKFKDSQNLLHSYTDWDSVIREFEIIGEASKHLLKADVLEKEHRSVVDFRNIIVHEYFGIDSEEVWDIIHNDLKTFKDMIIQLIDLLEINLKTELIDTYIEDNQYLDFVVSALRALK